MSHFLATRNMDSTRIGIPSLKFNSDKQQHASSKAFNDFIEQSEFRYNAQYPDPSSNAKCQCERELAEKDIETVRNDWVLKDKVKKTLFFFTSLVRTGLERC